MFRWNLSIKIVAAYSGLIALMAGILTTTLYWQFRTANQQAMRDRLLDLLSLTAPEIDSDYHSLVVTPKDTNKPFYKLNLEELKTVQAASKDVNRIYTLRPQSNGKFAFVLDVYPTSKSSTFVGEIAENLTPILSAEGNTLSQPKVENDFVQNTEGKSLLYGYAPITDQFGRLEGILAIELDAISILQSEQIGAAIALGLFVIILALTVIMVRWLARSLIVNRTLRLNDAAKKLAAGEWNQSLLTESDDELGELANSFNYMAGQLQTSFQKLEEYSQTLEQKVKERTVELEQAKLIADSANQAKSTFIANMSHELRSPLNAILGFAQIMTRSQTLGRENQETEYIQYLIDLLELYQQGIDWNSQITQEKIEDIELDFLLTDLPRLIKSMKKGTKRIAEISKSMRTFSRDDTIAKVTFNIHDGIDSTLLILRHRLKANEKRPEIEVVKNYGKLPPVYCYPGQLNQVFMNLIANAIDALEESNFGKTFEEIEAAQNQITITTEIDSKNQQTIIQIRDNGIGMSEEVKNQIFGHLFTTKKVGKGTGLGLSISRQIVEEKHGGQITFTSELGKGSEFTISLPNN